MRVLEAMLRESDGGEQAVAEGSSGAEGTEALPTVLHADDPTHHAHHVPLVRARGGPALVLVLVPVLVARRAPGPPHPHSYGPRPPPPGPDRAVGRGRRPDPAPALRGAPPPVVKGISVILPLRRKNVKKERRDRKVNLCSRGLRSHVVKNGGS